jgi:hypothetical protein
VVEGQNVSFFGNVAVARISENSCKGLCEWCMGAPAVVDKICEKLYKCAM